jgi:hypothetical protein
MAPILIVFLPLTWLCLVKLVFPSPGAPVSGARALIQEELLALGPPSRGAAPLNARCAEQSMAQDAR